MAGMLCGFGLNLYLWQFTRVPFTWYVMLGSLATFAVGYGASFLAGAPKIKIAAGASDGQ